MVVANSVELGQLPSDIGQQLSPVKKIVDSIKRITDTIKYGLVHDTINYNQYVQFSAYSDNVFGFTLLHHIGSWRPMLPGNYWGLELVTTIQSPAAKNIGGFLLYGLSDDKLLLQAGVGYLNQ